MKLRFKVLIRVLIVFILVCIIFIYSYIINRKNEELKELINRIEFTGNLLAQINSSPLYEFDSEKLETNLKSFLYDPDICSISLQGIDEVIDLAFNDPDKECKNTVSVVKKIFYSDIYIGTIEILFTTDNIDTRVEESIKHFLVILSASICLIVISLVLILNKTFEPIKILTELSKDISNGNLDRDILVDQNDEVGVLSRSFLKMRDSIRQKIEELSYANSQLNEHKQNLEVLVESRTNELSESFERLKKTQEQLVESEKMASLGGLVAGISHEINTPIGIGVTAASHLEEEAVLFNKKYSEGAISRKNLELFIHDVIEASKLILSNMNKADRLIQSFKKVAVDQTSELNRKFYIHEYIKEILTSLMVEFRHTKHEIKTVCKEDFIVDSYPGALSQIITNLLLNSLIHGFENIDRGLITLAIERSNHDVIITYSDTGIGISKENIKKVFEPFYTTKRGHGGTGLGLHIVYNLVSQTLGGNIKCESGIGKGVKFYLRFPYV